MYFKKIELILFLVLVTMMSELTAGKDTKSKTILKIQPDRCGYSAPNKQCEALLKLRWITKKFGNYCLFEQRIGKLDSIKKVKCWQKRSKARLDIQFKSADSIYYILKSGEMTLAKIKVTVAKITRRLKKRRRRPWHLF